MLKIYCKKCGSPTSYSLNKPKFCSACGNSFQENITPNINQKEINPPKLTINKFKNINRPEIDIEDDLDSENIDISKININNLKIEYSQDKTDNIKIKDLIGTSSGGNTLRKNKIKKTKINKKQFLEDFQKEAGTLRRKNV